jgi:hypothetical protein
MTELPQILERLEDSARKIYEPSQIWLESIQFADYVNQLAVHLKDCGAEDCNVNVAEQLINMASSFKVMGENALVVLDEIEEGYNGTQQ